MDKNFKGTIKVYWSSVREQVKRVNPSFAAIVDQIDPGKEFPLLIAYYPYGSLFGDEESIFIPNRDGGSYRLKLPNEGIPTEIAELLGYANHSAPLCMVLEKTIEYYIEQKNDNLVMPWTIYRPGDFLSIFKYFSSSSNHSYTPDGIFSASAGARSAFMLPSIGCSQQYVNLLRDFNVRSSIPKNLYAHWKIFSEIAKKSETSWNASLLIFPEVWLKKIFHDKAWFALKLFMHEKTWQRFRYEQNRSFYDVIFSLIQRKRNLKPSPYLVDTARHLFSIATGAASGYAPACTDDSLPLDVLQNAFLSSYGLKKYIPTIICPALFNSEDDKLPIYYSLQYPTTRAFSPKARKISSTITELYELEHITRIFVEELSRDETSLCSGTILSQIAKNCHFDFYHNEIDTRGVILPSDKIVTNDTRFLFKPSSMSSDAEFASDAKFVRGCVAIRLKDKSFSTEVTKNDAYYSHETA